MVFHLLQADVNGYCVCLECENKVTFWALACLALCKFFLRDYLEVEVGRV